LVQDEWGRLVLLHGLHFVFVLSLGRCARDVSEIKWSVSK
jgi:hypothetical protein